jgi:hypothetical protein
LNARIKVGPQDKNIAMTTNARPRREEIPYIAASSNAQAAPTVQIHSNDISDRLHHESKVFSEARADQLVAAPAVTVSSVVENQIAPSIDVLVMLKPALPKHPHEFAASPADSAFQRLPVCRPSFWG